MEAQHPWPSVVVFGPCTPILWTRAFWPIPRSVPPAQDLGSTSWNPSPAVFQSTFSGKQIVHHMATEHLVLTAGPAPLTLLTPSHPILPIHQG